MKKITIILAGFFLFVNVKNVNAQANKECITKYNLFKGDFLSKKYDDAYPNLVDLMNNCPKLSVNIYKLGDKLAKKRFKKASNKTEAVAFIKKIYEQRLHYFPKKNPAKAHSDYATFLAKNKLSSKEEIFSILEKAYKISPKNMSVKNIYKYFKGVTEKNKNTNPQKVFDTYDDVIESVGEKLKDYSKKIYNLTKDSTRILDKKEAKKLKGYKINSKALGSVETSLDAIISKLATCDRLIPLYNRDFEKNKTNATWLKRAVSRMYNKGCQEDPLYEKLARAYAEASPSADSYSFLAGILDKNGNVNGATQMRQKAFDLETDPYKKANFKLKFAHFAKKRGQKAKARSLAYEALKFNPSFGKAYLFIGSLYASSANSCGKDEFEKRMVYVAAYNKARKAATVDPSISSLAKKYMRNYKAKFPSKKVIFLKSIASGSSYKIGCWIRETVRVP